MAGKPQPPAPPPPPSFRYDIEFLGLLPGGTFAQAGAINNHGDIVGGADSSDPQARTFLWTADTGSMVPINSLIDPAERCSFWVVNDINDSGQITGYAYFKDDEEALGTPEARAVRFNPDDGDADSYGTVQTLGLPFYDGVGQRVAAMNAQGDVVGSYFDQDDRRYLFLYTDVDGIHVLASNAWVETPILPMAITDRDPVTGAVTIVGNYGSSGYIDGWRTSWTPGVSTGATLTTIPAKFSDRRTNPMSAVYGVNNQGEMVGETTVARTSTGPGRYTVSGGWTILSTTGGWATAINNATVDHPSISVGWSGRPFIYSDTFKLWDLASLVDTPTDYAASLGDPADINDQKWICGPGDHTSGPAYVLIPKPAP